MTTDLAAMVAAVCHAADLIEAQVEWLDRGSSLRRIHEASLPDIRAARRLLEAISDRDVVALALFDNEENADEDWDEIGEGIREVYRLDGDGFVAALLARAGDVSLATRPAGQANLPIRCECGIRERRYCVPGSCSHPTRGAGG